MTKSRMRAKKVFDPSDTHIPKKRGRPSGTHHKSEKAHLKSSHQHHEERPESRSSSTGRSIEHANVCSVCHLQNKKGANERMVSCRECSNKAHIVCLNNTDDVLFKMYPDNSWQCPHCKICVICFETSDAGSLAVCSVCADGYHTTCHQPKIIDRHKWTCINCQTSDDMNVNEIRSKLSSNLHSKPESASVSPSNSGISSPSNNFNSPPMSPTPPHLSPQTGLNRDSPDPDSQSNRDSEDKEHEENIDPSIPDATNWSYEDVYQYFAQYFPEEAHIFRDQEIDGRSLLLLKRIDVLTSLQLKLGPALKIYRHIVKLQVRRDDPKMYWL